MSLNIQDLGLEQTVRDIIGDLNSGEVYIVKAGNAPTGSNPFATDVDKPEPVLVGTFPFISFKDGATKFNEDTGIREGGYYSVKLGTPVPYIEVNDLCYINFSLEKKVAIGTVDQVSIGISSIVELRVKRVNTLPYTFEDIKALL